MAWMSWKISVQHWECKKMTVAELPEYIVECPEGYKISLNKPITIDSANVQVLTMREPTVQDMLAAEMQAKGQSEANQEIIS